MRDGTTRLETLSITSNERRARKWRNRFHATLYTLWDKFKAHFERSQSGFRVSGASEIDPDGPVYVYMYMFCRVKEHRSEIDGGMSSRHF